MLNRLKSAVSGAVEGLEGSRSGSSRAQANPGPPKHEYSRPSFMKLPEIALSISKDKKVRPILSASSSSPLPYNSGYAECVNAGKSSFNEDMAQLYHGTLKCNISDFEEAILPYAYYAIFDGHAGYGASLDASKQLHHILHQKLVNSMDIIFASLKTPAQPKTIDRKTIIIGCLEAAFVEMDEIIGETQTMNFQNPGGCTALVALFMLGDLYIANAGDCRAGICDNGKFVQISNDFSPFYDKERIYRKASENPSLLGNGYNIREYYDVPSRDNLGKMVLYKEPYMKGWSYKTLTVDDLKTPLITGTGRRSRIMGTIGVARGFGDFELSSIHHKVPIKPLLSCIPEVTVYSQTDLVTNYAVLIMASDGLWDAVDPSDVADICCDLNLSTMNDLNKYVTVAMNLVAAARGRKNHVTNMWMLKNSNQASVDDISVFVIPFQPYAYKRCEIITKTLPKVLWPMNVYESDSGEPEEQMDMDQISNDGTEITQVAELDEVLNELLVVKFERDILEDDAQRLRDIAENEVQVKCEVDSPEKSTDEDFNNKRSHSDTE
ncbi:PREDICTED: protein phosphatase 1H [Nicrophorus vespilloides]|uniref:Protein phosphatase 1H n=1 Tax=Nicrophorus vespilloides TaxID=110193 RepID=A0ABM1NBS5_NICVS|nr:PREDICTED: protein phosphatase 1H [Nicrophorus vespilloides]